MNIVLIGMPACGKSTVAKILAKELNAEVYDTDGEIEKSYGKIAEIFSRFGEEKFREIESGVIKKVCKMQNAVIATGGGSVLKSENVKCFKACGKTVYLKTEVKTLLARVKKGDNRPLLAGNIEESFKKLLKEREDIYFRAADFTVQTDGLTPREVASAILSLINDIKG